MRWANPQEDPRAPEFVTGPNYVQYETPYSSQWRSLRGQSHADINPEEDTLAKFYYENGARLGDKPCMGERALSHKGEELKDYVFTSWHDATERSKNIGKGLLSLGAKAGDHIGIFATNQPDWAMSEYGCYSQRLTVVPLYPACGEGTIRYIARHAELEICLCGSKQLPQLFFEAVAKGEGEDQSTMLKYVVIVGLDAEEALEGLTEEQKQLCKDQGVEVMTIRTLIEKGKSRDDELNLPTPDDLMSIVYTSGSEGTPKGVIIKHKTSTSSMRIFLTSPAWGEDISNWMYYSYLPLAHVFERQLSSLFILTGATIAYTSGLQNLMADMGAVRPHLIVGVPRVWQRIYSVFTRVTSSLPWFKRVLFTSALNSKIEALRTCGKVNSWTGWEDMILGTASAKMGGRLRIAINGGAAADPDLSLWFQAVFNCTFLQGYGLTETYGAVSMQIPSCSADMGTIGPPADMVTVRILDVPEMEYSSKADPPCGELLVRGDNISSAYYKLPDQSALSFDEEGFFHTGDIARVNPDASLTIVDRKKNLFKLAQGEYVALEYLETVYGRTEEIQQIWIWGDRLSTFLVAVVVPEMESLRAKAAEMGLGDLTDQELCEKKEMKEFIMSRMDESAKQANLLGFQKVKAIVLEPEPWTVESNLLTPTFKFRRTRLLDKYRSKLGEISEEYKRVSEAGKSQSGESGKIDSVAKSDGQKAPEGDKENKEKTPEDKNEENAWFYTRFINYVWSWFE